MKRGGRKFDFNFRQSVAASGKWFIYNNGRRVKSNTQNRMLAIRGGCWKNKKFEIPSAYSVLSCLTKDDPGTFEDFCGDFGYDTDSRKAETIYKAVVNEYQNVCMLWNESEIELLWKIQ